MRHRQWVLVLALVLVVLVPLARLGLRFASRHPALRHAVAARLASATGGQVSIGEIEVGLPSVRFSDVRIDLPGGGVIEVPQATVAVSLGRLLSTGFRFDRSIGSVVVTHPRVVLVVGDTTGRGRRAGDLASVFDALPHRIGVSDASITVVDHEGAWSYGATSLDLLAERGAGGRFAGSVQGDMPGGAGSITGQLNWDAASRTLSVDGRVAGADVALGSPVPPAGPARVTSGVLDAALAVTARDTGSDSFSIAFDLDRGVLEWVEGGEVVESVTAHGTFDGARLELAAASGSWRGSELRADGALSIAACAFDSVDVRAVDAPLARIADLVSIDSSEVSGAADLALTIDGPFSDPAADIAFDGSSLDLYGVPFTRLRGRVRVTNAGIEASGIDGEVAGGRIAASGSAARVADGDGWRLEIEGDADGLELAEIVGDTGGLEVAGRVSLDGFRLSGSPEVPRVETTVRWERLAIGRVSLGPGGGGALFDRERVAVAFRARDGSYAVEGTGEGVLSHPSVDLDVELSGLKADSALGLPRAPFVPRTLDGRIELDGTLDALSMDGTIEAHGPDLDGVFAVTGGLTAGPPGRVLTLSCASDSAAVRGLRLPVSADVVIDAGGVDLARFEAGRFARASLRVGSDRGLSGTLVVSEAEVTDVVRALTGSPPPDGIAGLLFASISVGGTLDAPEADVDASVGGGTAVGVTGLAADLIGSLRDGTFTLRNLALSADEREFLTASGTADLDGELSVSARGAGIPGALLLGDPETEFGATVGIGGTLRDPTLDCRIASSGGRFLGVPFDDLVARVTGAEGVARVEPLALERAGSYRLVASGRIPYSVLARENPGEGELTIEVDGDPLALLAEATHLATEVSGDGTMNLHVVGNREGFEIATGDVDARATSLSPSGLFRELTDVAVSASVVDGVVVSADVTALVDGRAVRLRSSGDAGADGSPREPLSVLGLTVGALALSTDPRGVRVGIPGLMRPGDVGNVAARGRDGAPEFLITGPAEHPLLVGELELSDMTFAYPFLESGAGFGGSFLSIAEWSVRMVAGRNLWYARPDATLNVERGGALDFLGTASDHTLCVAGRVEARRGDVNYGGADFNVREASVEFPAFCEPPRFYIEAETRVEDGTTITLTMDSIEDDLTLATPGGTLDESALTLSSDAPEDDTQDKILSKLQYGMSYELLEGEEQASLERKRAIDVVGSQIGGIIVRPLVSPIETRLRRDLRLDLVRIEVDFMSQFLSQLDEWRAQEGRAQYAPFFADSRITLGKYLTKDWMLSYVGRTETVEEGIGYQRLDLRHEIGVEYEVSRHTSLSLRAVYDPAASAWDRWISVENRFRF